MAFAETRDRATKVLARSGPARYARFEKQRGGRTGSAEAVKGPIIEATAPMVEPDCDGGRLWYRRGKPKSEKQPRDGLATDGSSASMCPREVKQKGGKTKGKQGRNSRTKKAEGNKKKRTVKTMSD